MGDYHGNVLCFYFCIACIAGEMPGICVWQCNVKHNGLLGKTAVVFCPRCVGLLTGICWMESQSPLFSRAWGLLLQMTDASSMSCIRPIMFLNQGMTHPKKFLKEGPGSDQGGSSFRPGWVGQIFAISKPIP